LASEALLEVAMELEEPVEQKLASLVEVLRLLLLNWMQNQRNFLEMSAIEYELDLAAILNYIPRFRRQIFFVLSID
jgi:hypothetical protein